MHFKLLNWWEALCFKDMQVGILTNEETATCSLWLKRIFVVKAEMLGWS